MKKQPYPAAMPRPQPSTREGRIQRLLRSTDLTREQAAKIVDRNTVEQPAKWVY